MARRYVLPLLAVVLFASAVLHVVWARQVPPPLPPPVAPPRTPFAGTVAGAGLVEAQTENISVGSPLAGVVTKVPAKVGQNVTVGTPLFQLDDRQLQAELKVRQAALASAKAQLRRLEALPRKEELPPSEARVREAEANLADEEDMLRRAQRLIHRGAVSAEELSRRRQATGMARERLNRARAEYDLLKAGAWEADKAIAAETAAQAQAQLEQTKTELDRLVVRALVDGEVLQVNVRPGEFVGVPPGQALVVLGNVHRLHLRVDIDEHDIPHFRPDAPARAVLRGDPGRELHLSFVRVEPYVVPKKSLTGINTERVDVRVLRVIYAVDAADQTLYVGQQMDVFIGAGTNEGVTYGRLRP
jgi:multidrug resistance efflux pump